MQIVPSTTRLFVADLHLEHPSSVQFLRFRELLEAWRQRVTGIYLLGDITELWIGDDDDSALADALRDLLTSTARCCPVYLMHGNRDFFYGQHLADATGATLLADPTPLPDGLLLAHGDAFCVDDQPYQHFRTMVRGPAWQADILGRSLAERRALGADMRAQSKMTNANKAANIMDVNADAVALALHEAGCQSLVHGHTHRPGRHQLDSGERLVLGSWDGRVGWYGLQIQGLLSLHVFSLAHRYEIGTQDPAN